MELWVRCRERLIARDGCGLWVRRCENMLRVNNENFDNSDYKITGFLGGSGGKFTSSDKKRTHPIRVGTPVFDVLSIIYKRVAFRLLRGLRISTLRFNPNSTPHSDTTRHTPHGRVCREHSKRPLCQIVAVL